MAGVWSNTDTVRQNTVNGVNFLHNMLNETDPALPEPVRLFLKVLPRIKLQVDLNGAMPTLFSYNVNELILLNLIVIYNLTEQIHSSYNGWSLTLITAETKSHRSALTTSFPESLPQQDDHENGGEIAII